MTAHLKAGVAVIGGSHRGSRPWPALARPESSTPTFGAIVIETLALAGAAEGERELFAFTHGGGAWKVTLK